MLSDEAVYCKEHVVQKPLFEVETKPLYYSKAPGNYTIDPTPKQIGHTTVDGIAVHF